MTDALRFALDIDHIYPVLGIAYQGWKPLSQDRIDLLLETLDEVLPIRAEEIAQYDTIRSRKGEPDFHRIDLFCWEPQRGDVLSGGYRSRPGYLRGSLYQRLASGRTGRKHRRSKRHKSQTKKARPDND